MKDAAARDRDGGAVLINCFQAINVVQLPLGTPLSQSVTRTSDRHRGRSQKSFVCHVLGQSY